MNVHTNARLTPSGRAVMVSRIEDEGWPVKRAAQASGISRRTKSKCSSTRQVFPVDMPSMMIRPIIAANTPYSTSVTPDSLRMKQRTRLST